MLKIEQTRMIMADARDGGLLNFCKEISQYMLRRLMVGGGGGGSRFDASFMRPVADGGSWHSCLADP